MQVAEQRCTTKMAQGSLSQQKRGSLSQFGSRTASGHLAKKNEGHLANSRFWDRFGGFGLRAYSLAVLDLGFRAVGFRA